MSSLRARLLPLFLLRVPGALILCAAASAVFAVIGEPRAALGVALGWALYVANVLLIREIARSLVESQGSDARAVRRGKILSAVSASTRLLMMFVVLALVGKELGRLAALGACVGLFLAQTNLHRGRLWLREAAER